MQVLLILLLAVMLLMLLAYLFALSDDKWVMPFIVLALVEVLFMVFFVCRLD